MRRTSMNNKKYEKDVYRITKLNRESQNSRLRMFARVDAGVKIEIIKSQNKLFHALKNIGFHNEENATLTLASLILSVDKIVNNLNGTQLNLLKFNSQNQRKGGNKREQILGYWAVIKELKEQKMSFRKIAKYLKKYHRLEVSYSAIYALWAEIENNK